MFGRELSRWSGPASNHHRSTIPEQARLWSDRIYVVLGHGGFFSPRRSRACATRDSCRVPITLRSATISYATFATGSPGPRNVLEYWRRAGAGPQQLHVRTSCPRALHGDRGRLTSLARTRKFGAHGRARSRRARVGRAHDRITFIPYCPKREGMNLGFAYNELMGRLREDDWACFIDHDACFTTKDWYAQLEEITAPLTAPCVLTATTNRVGSRWQLAPGVNPHDHSMVYHRRFGTSVQSAARAGAAGRHARAADERGRHPSIPKNLAAARGIRGRVSRRRQCDPPGSSRSGTQGLPHGGGLCLPLVPRKRRCSAQPRRFGNSVAATDRHRNSERHTCRTDRAASSRRSVQPHRGRYGSKRPTERRIEPTGLESGSDQPAIASS